MIVLLKCALVVLAVALLLALASAVLSSVAQGISDGLTQVQTMLSVAAEYFAIGASAVTLLVVAVVGLKIGRFLIRRGQEQQQVPSSSQQASEQFFRTTHVPTWSPREQRAGQAYTKTTVPAGWYPDPQGTGQRRYWDGTSWSQHLTTGQVTAASPPAGWFPDPSRPGHLRWWDGSSWSHHFIPADSANQIDQRDAQPRIKMTTAEWHAHVEAWATTGAIHQELWRRLSSAELVDADNLTLEAQRTLEQLSPEQGADRLQELMRSNPARKHDQLLQDLVNLVLRQPTEALLRTKRWSGSRRD